MSQLDYIPFDCDNHYYEAEDAFTRHVPREMHARGVQWAQIGNHKHHIVGGKLAHAVKNPTWDPIAKPGAIADYLRGNPEKMDAKSLLQEREPLPIEYMDHDARVATLEEQGLAGIWLFPTLGVLYEELLKRDVEAVKSVFRGFNRWIEEDWGCNYKGKIFASPYISLADVDFACEEFEWAVAQGARTVCMRPAAVWTAHEVTRSPADPLFDPFWARVNEAGITVVIHAGDSGYTTHGYTRDGFHAGGVSGPMRPSIKQFNIERAAYDFLITLAYEKLFERFPNVRMASVENGAEFLPDLFRKLRQSRDRMGGTGYYKEDPGLLFKEHIWINPFWEDDVYEVESLMGADRVIFGSDWPHIEGMPQPLDYVKELSDFDAATKKRILLDNVVELNEVRPG
jgi:predicted TIM-barrel fold metal-dependent hydrolase